MVLTSSYVALGVACLAATAAAAPMVDRRSLFGNSNHKPVQEGYNDPSKAGDMVYHLNATTGNCGDTKMTSSYMTNAARTKTYLQKAIAYTTSRLHVELHEGTCQDQGYTKQVGTTTYTYSYHVYTVKVWAKGPSTGGKGAQGDACEDKQGFSNQYGSCSTYVSKKWCAGGSTGSAWKPSWGAVGADAKEACCACGGGASGGAAPVAQKKSCTFQGETTMHGGDYDGPTHTCVCSDGKWVSCVRIAASGSDRTKTN